jgi:hypothetical protein
MEKVRLAAHLTIFDVGLGVSTRLIHRSLIPLAATRALESRRHGIFIFILGMRIANGK